jgi:hypothetical protein
MTAPLVPLPQLVPTCQAGPEALPEQQVTVELFPDVAIALPEMTRAASKNNIFILIFLCLFFYCGFFYIVHQYCLL